MKDYIAQRAMNIATYIIENNATVRQAAKQFGVSKSTVHVDGTIGNGLCGWWSNKNLQISVLLQYRLFWRCRMNTVSLLCKNCEKETKVMICEENDVLMWLDEERNKVDVKLTGDVLRGICPKCECSIVSDKVPLDIKIKVARTKADKPSKNSRHGVNTRGEIEKNIHRHG